MAVMSVERLKGMDLYDRSNERVGDIRDVILDPEDGRVRYALVGTGGMLSALGIQDKLFAIPFARLTIGDDRIRLDEGRETFKEAPSFSAYQPPEFSRDYERKLHDFWQIQPYWEQPGYRLTERRAGDLLERQVPIVRPNTPIAEVADTLVRTGNVAVPVVDEQGEYLGLITAQKLTELAVSAGTVAKRRHEEEVRSEEFELKEGRPKGERFAPEAREAERARQEPQESMEQPRTQERSVLESDQDMRQREEPGRRPEAA